MKGKAALIAFISLIICCSAQAQTASNKADVEFKSISVNRVDLSNQTADANLTVEVKNPGPALRVKDAQYKIRLNGKQLAEGKYDKEISLPANSTTTLELPLTINLRALPAVTWNFLWEGMTLRYDADTEFVVSVLSFNSGKIKTTFTGKQPISALLSSVYKKVREHLK